MAARINDWLNTEFLQKVLRISDNERSIIVKNFTTKPAVGKGDNYGSIMVRASVEYSRNESGRNLTEKKSVIVKIAPTTNSTLKSVVAKEFETEIQMMKTTLNEMNALLNEQGYRLNPRVLYAEIGDPTLLVIEDLAPLGYRMVDRQAGLDLEHSTLAIRGLAKFHASSVAVFEKNPKSMEAYQKGTFRDDMPEEIKIPFKAGIRILANELLNWPELGSRYVRRLDSDHYTFGHYYSEKLLKLMDSCYKKATECCMLKNDQFAVLNHGDVWTNNFLFRYDNDNKVTDLIFVDFQMCWWASPAVDIFRFMNTTTAEDVELHHHTALLEEYLKILSDTMTRLQCKTKPPSMANLKKMLKDHEILAIIWSAVALPFVLMDKGEIMTLDEIIQRGDDFVKPAYKGLVYRKKMLRRLSAWNSSGLLDFI